MRALVLGDEGLAFEADRPEPTPGPADALVRVRLAGICATDLELRAGYKGFRGVLGHEFVGTVERCAKRPELVGRRVVGEVNAACGACATCRAGRRTHCPWRTALGILGHDGAFADRLVLPAESLHVVPDLVPDARAVFAEPLAAACRIPEQVVAAPGVRAVVVGDGKLGLLCAQVLRRHGCDVTLLGRHAEKLRVVAGRGVETATDPSTVKPGADLVVDATGSPSGFETALSLVRPLGALVLKSTHGRAPVPVDLNRLVVDEVAVVGSRCGPFPPALELLAGGAVEVDALVEALYPLERGLEAFDHAARRGALKVLLEIA